MPDCLKALIAKLKPSDFDGISVVINLAITNQYTSVEQLNKDLKDKCPGFMDLFLWFLGWIKIFWNAFIDGLDSSLWNLFKLVRLSFVDHSLTG